MSSRDIHYAYTAAGADHSSRTSDLLRSCCLAVIGTAVIAAAAHVAIPVPFTGVPFTLQPLAVLLAGLLFGPWLGAATLCLYLLEGASGLPVFQPLGPGGIAQLVGLTGGFLLSYPVVAAIAGSLYRSLKLRSRYTAAVLACSAATCFLFVAGAVWFSVLTHTGIQATFLLLVLPFLPSEAVKVLAAAGIASAWNNHTARS